VSKSRIFNARKTSLSGAKVKLYDSTPALFKDDVITAGAITVADSRDGFVSWNDHGALVFRPGTYTIPKPINEMTQKDLDACWTPNAEPKASKMHSKAPRTLLQPRKPPPKPSGG